MSNVHAELLKRFCQPEWALFFEVRDATGFKGEGRSADAVAMNCYPSRGMEIWGFEVKTDRGDWLREMRNPQKSVAVQQYCDRWFLATTEDIVKPGELPPTWGHFIVNGKGIRQVAEAPKLEAVPITRTFLASLLRNAAKSVQAQLPMLMENERQRLKKDMEDTLIARIDNLRGEGVELMKKVAAIREATGIDLEKWMPTEKVKRAISMALALDVHGYNGIGGVITSCTAIIKQMRKAAKDLGIELKAEDLEL